MKAPPGDAMIREASPGGAEPKTPVVEPEESEHELVYGFGERRLRVRGLTNNKSYDLLKVNLFITHQGRFFVDTVDLYQARQRAAFLKQAADELELPLDLLKEDLGKVILSLEQLQEKALAEETAPKSEGVTLTKEEREEALGLLRDPHLFQRILHDFDRLGVVGEETNKLVGYLATVSRKLEKPLAVIVQSSSAAGKSSLMEAVLAMVPEEERIKYSAMTGQSLYYLGETDIKHKILAIVEEEGAERASYALKLLQSEGELTIASTGKAPQTGQLQTNEYHVEGPVMIFLTTTAIEIDEELLNRCLVLTVDEGSKQTEAIHQSQRRGRTLAGLFGQRNRSTLLALHNNAQRLLRQLPVVNPYAERLTFAANKTRTRRDHMKYLTLIDTVALLCQYQRPTKTAMHAGEPVEYIEVTPGDIAIANQLAHQVLGRTLDELPPQTRRLLGLLQDMVDAECKSQEIDRLNFRFSRRQVREVTGWGNTQLKLHLGRLVEMEYLVLHRTHHAQRYLYELSFDGRGGEPHLAGLIDPEHLDPSYAQNRSGQNPNRSAEDANRSAPGRPEVGGWSARRIPSFRCSED